MRGAALKTRDPPMDREVATSPAWASVFCNTCGIRAVMAAPPPQRHGGTAVYQSHAFSSSPRLGWPPRKFQNTSLNIISFPKNGPCGTEWGCHRNSSGPTSAETYLLSCSVNMFPFLKPSFNQSDAVQPLPGENRPSAWHSATSGLRNVPDRCPRGNKSSQMCHSIFQLWSCKDMHHHSLGGATFPPRI